MSPLPFLTELQYCQNLSKAESDFHETWKTDFMSDVACCQLNHCTGGGRANKG